MDEETVEPNICLMQDKPRAIIPYTLKIDGKTVFIIMNTWPVPDLTYTLLIDDGIKSIVGDKMESALPFRLKFKSEVLSEVHILFPSNFLEVADGDLAVRWKESSTTSLEHRYYMEVATENSFDNIVFKASIDKTGELDQAGIYEAIVPRNSILDLGQYFIRIRAESTKSYGKWSETITFVRPKDAISIPNPQPGEKQRPTLPVITDYTKDASGTVISSSATAVPIISATTVTPSVSVTTADNITFEDLPSNFTVAYDAPINIDNIFVTVERRSF